MRAFWIGALLLGVFSFAGCKRTEAPKPSPDTAEKGAHTMSFSLSSTAFIEGSTIPKKYSCDGDDVSPPLTWTGVPDGARSLALIMDDPDAPMGTWVHWVLYGLPPSTPSLPEGVPKEVTLPGAIKQGRNSWQKTGYGGPCPPAGKPHRYFFKLYALDSEPDLPSGADRAALEQAIKGHVIAEARLMGTFGR